MVSTITDRGPPACPGRPPPPRKFENPSISVGSAEAAEKGGYAHFMLKEIHEQPDGPDGAMTGRLRGESGLPGGARPDSGAAGRDRSRRDDRVRYGLYASLVGGAVPEWLGIPPVPRWRPSSATSPPPIDSRTLVVAVAVRRDRRTRSPRRALAGDRGAVVCGRNQHSGLGDHSRVSRLFFLQAGPEVPSQATRHRDPGRNPGDAGPRTCPPVKRLSAEKVRELVAALRRDCRNRPKERSSWRDQSRRLRRDTPTRPGFIYIGRIVRYPAALEVCAQDQEISYLHAEGYAGGRAQAQAPSPFSMPTYSRRGGHTIGRIRQS